MSHSSCMPQQAISSRLEPGQLAICLEKAVAPLCILHAVSMQARIGLDTQHRSTPLSLCCVLVCIYSVLRHAKRLIKLRVCTVVGTREFYFVAAVNCTTAHVSCAHAHAQHCRLQSRS